MKTKIVLFVLGLLVKVIPGTLDDKALDLVKKLLKLK